MAIISNSGLRHRATINRAMELIGARIKANLYHRPVLVLGEPGVGKSYAFAELATDIGAEFRCVHLDNMEAVDVGGIPIPVPGENKCTFAPNEMFLFDPNPAKKYILLLDELTSCNPAVQLAAMQVALDRKINGNAIPDNVFIVAAGNRSEDGTRTYTMLAPLANRFAHLEIDNDVTGWLTWARRHGIHPNVIGFIGYAPSKLHAMDEVMAAAASDGVKKKSGNTGRFSGPWASNRSVAAVSDLVWLADSGDISEDDLYEQVSMEVGEAWALEFCAFRKIAGAYDNVREIMLDPTKTVKIPQKPDMKFAFASAVVFNVWKAHSEDEQEKLVQGFYRILGDAGMDSSFATKIMEEAKEGSATVSKEQACDMIVVNHPVEFAAWSKKFGSSNRAKI